MNRFWLKNMLIVTVFLAKLNTTALAEAFKPEEEAWNDVSKWTSVSYKHGGIKVKFPKDWIATTWGGKFDPKGTNVELNSPEKKNQQNKYEPNQMGTLIRFDNIEAIPFGGFLARLKIKNTKEYIDQRAVENIQEAKIIKEEAVTGNGQIWRFFTLSGCPEYNPTTKICEVEAIHYRAFLERKDKTEKFNGHFYDVLFTEGLILENEKRAYFPMDKQPRKELYIKILENIEYLKK